jgi:hypothetical protein
MSQYDDIIQAAAQKFNVDPKLIRGIIQTESSGNPSAVGKTQSGAVGGTGLMGINPVNFKKYGVTDPSDPAQSINAGAAILSGLLDKYGDVNAALTHYVGGDDPKQWGPQTAAYPGKVLAAAGIGAQQAPATPSTLPGIPVIRPPAQSGAAPAAADPFSSLAVAGAPAKSEIQATDPFSSLPVAGSTTAATQSGSAAAPSQQSATQSGGAISDFLSAAGHHLIKPFQGAVQLGEHAVNAAAQAAAPGSSFANYTQNLVNQDDAALRAKEAAYQASVPNSLPAYAGAAAGEIIPALMGGSSLVSKGAEAGSALAARLGAQGGVASLLRAGGGSAGSAALGGVYSALQPVLDQGDFASQKAGQIGAGAAVGTLTPALTGGLGALGKYAGNAIGSAVRPFTQEGRAQIAQDIIAQAARGGPAALNTASIIPGSTPTLSEATANPGIATLQRTLRDLNPSPFIEREQQNAAARLGALNGITGAPEDLLAAQAARDTNAASNYLSTQVGIPTSNTGYSALKQTPAFQSAFKQAQTMAKNAGASSIETTVQNRANANMGGALGAPQTYVSGTGLHWIKQALDDQINSAAQAGEKSQASNLLGVKDQLLGLMDQEIPGYAQARGAYAAASRPIDAMQYLQGLNLTDAQGNITLAKVQNALSGIQKAQQKPGVNLAKSVDQSQVDALTSIRDDLLRASNTGLGRSAGSSTAQNLATQQMLRNVLPGKLGALASQLPTGTVGGALGTLLGYGTAGPLGAAVGAGVGARAGSALTSLMNTHNEAIQDEVARLLLNPSASVPALNRASVRALPFAPVNGLQRLLNPGLIGVGVGVNNSGRP